MIAISSGLYKQNSTFYVRLRTKGIETIRSLGQSSDYAFKVHSELLPSIQSLNHLSKTGCIGVDEIRGFHTKIVGMIEDKRKCLLDGFQMQSGMTDEQFRYISDLIESLNFEKLGFVTLDIQETKIEISYGQTTAVIEKAETEQMAAKKLKECLGDILELVAIRQTKQKAETFDKDLHNQTTSIAEFLRPFRNDPALLKQKKEQLIAFYSDWAEKQSNNNLFSLIDNDENLRNCLPYLSDEQISKVTLELSNKENIILDHLEAISAFLNSDRNRFNDLTKKYKTKPAVSELPQLTQPPKPTTPLLSEALTLFIERKAKTIKKLSARLETEFRNSVREVIRGLGDRPLEQYTADDFLELEATMSQLPVRFNAIHELAGLSYEEILQTNTAKQCDSKNRLTLTTISQKFQDITAIYKYLNYTNPLANFDYKTAPSTPRRVFTLPDLQKLIEFVSALDEKTKWFFLIGIYTGARSGETQQIRKQDLKKYDDILCFDINDDDGKKVKNKHSIRNVPVHSRLLSLGLVEFVNNSPTEFIFDKPPKSTEWPNYTSDLINNKFLPRYKIEKETKEGELVFHSLRHTFIDHIYNEKDQSLKHVKDLVGHEKAMGITGTYSHRKTPVPKLKLTLEVLYTELTN